MCSKVPNSSSGISQHLMSQSKRSPVQEASDLMKQPLIPQVRIVESV